MESARDSEHATPHGNRLRLLVDAGIALSSELSLDALLQRIVETAAELTGARYAALGVVDKTGQSLERFLTTGIDAETYASIGELPRGRGILGVLIRDARPLRLRDLADDPRSVGFPRNHPPMRTFLGVPDRLARRRVRQPLPDGEVGRCRVHRRRRRTDAAPRRAGRRRDRERSPVRLLDAAGSDSSRR